MQNKIRLVLAICCLYCHTLLYAQIKVDIQEPAFKPDTLLFPFRQGIQLIIIDHEVARQRKVDWYEGTRPRAMSWDMLIPPSMHNVYIFRDSSGQIVKAFNTSESYSSLTTGLLKTIGSKPPNVHSHLHPNISKDLQINVSSLFRRNRSPHSFDLKGYYRVYSGVVTPKRASGNLRQEQDYTGMIDSLGNIIFPRNYAVIAKAGQHFMVKQGGLYGIIDITMKPIIPLEADMVAIPEEGLFIFSKKDVLTTMYHASSNEVIRVKEYDWVERDYIQPDRVNPVNPLVRISLNGQLGYINHRFKVVVAPIYDYASPVFRDGLALVSRNQKWGYVNAKGQEQIPCIYDDAIQFEKGSAAVRKGDNSFCISTTGETVSGCTLRYAQWEQISEWNQQPYIKDRRIVRRGQSYGLTNSNGVLIVPLIYETINCIQVRYQKNPCHQQFYKVRRHGKWGIMDKNGKEVLPCIYDMVDDHFKGEKNVLSVEKSKSYGLLDSNMKWVIPCRYEALNPYSIPGMIIFSKNNKWGWMTMNEKVVVHPQFDEVGWMHDGKTKVRKDGLYGYADINGRIIIPCSFQHLGDKFYNGLIIAAQKDSWGYADSVGNILIPFTFTSVRNFHSSIAGVQKGKLFGFINKQGKPVTDFMYDFIDHEWSSDGRIKVQRNGKFGFVDETGTEVIPCIYDDVRGFRPGMGHNVLLNGQWMYVK